MNGIDGIVFDLDGTLWDTCEACAIAWNAVVADEGMRFREITAEDIRRVTGRPHEECVREVFRGFSEEQILRLSERTQAEDNRVIRERGGMLYPGVAEILPRLAATRPVFIVSNCQAGYIEIFLDQCGWRSLVRDIECWGNTGLTKDENLRRVLERNRLASAIFVGDGGSDAHAARACGIPFVWAAYGFGERQPAAAEISNFAELEGVLASLDGSHRP